MQTNKDVETATGCRNMIHAARQDMIDDSKKPDPMITLENVNGCRRHFRIIDFWNDQLCKAMGWSYDA